MFKSGQTSVTQIERLSRGMLYGTARQRRRARLDEKPSIRALERAQDYLKLPTEAPTVPLLQTPGTTPLFPTVDLTSGEVVGRNYKRRRRVGFIHFMNTIVAAYPEREIHEFPILGNL